MSCSVFPQMRANCNPSEDLLQRNESKSSNVMFSLIQTAVEDRLDPYKYLTLLMMQAKDSNLTDVQIVQCLLPWDAPA